MSLLQNLTTIVMAVALLTPAAAAWRATPPLESEQARRLPKDTGAPLRYVALGDSTVTGVGATSPRRHYVGRLHDRLVVVYPRATLANLGVPGATAADVIRDQLPRAVALRPQLVTLSVGPNDITQGRRPADFEQDVGEIFRTLHRDSDAVVVVNLLPDLALSPRFTPAERLVVGQLTATFNVMLAEQARRYGVEIVDLYDRSRRETPNRPDYLSADDYHPSDEGYARWAEVMWRGVEFRRPSSSTP
ncbi:MAG: SGNH/GDSL hydrolase family protein [Chloroflexi bacterium]|nr:SGNH/GDSL hydrolase family protein [Chloroflexota bacterium]